MTQEEFELAVARIRSGDKDGLKDIYLAYMKFIYAVIYNIVGSKETAEDLTSDVFIKLWDALDSYQGGNGHKGYLATIARNMAIDYMRKAGREIPMPYESSEEEDGRAQTSGASIFDTGGEIDLSGNSEIGGRNSNPEVAVISQMNVMDALNQLSMQEREIVERKVLADMTFKEISEELRIAMGTVTWRYREAMNKLRRCGYE